MISFDGCGVITMFKPSLGSSEDSNAVIVSVTGCEAIGVLIAKSRGSPEAAGVSGASSGSGVCIDISDAIGLSIVIGSSDSNGAITVFTTGVCDIALFSAGDSIGSDDGTSCDSIGEGRTGSSAETPGVNSGI